MDKRSDQQLVADYLTGDEKALELLVRRYLKPVYGFVYRYAGGAVDAEDITQEVFVKVWRNMKKFDREKSFKTWIFSIAKNTALDFLKKKKVIMFSEFENEAGENAILETLTDPAPLADELFARADLKATLARALERLSPKYRMALSLYYNNNLNFREIGESLGEPLNTVKSRHRRALAILRSLLNV